MHCFFHHGGTEILGIYVVPLRGVPELAIGLKHGIL
jgi:hypothetical protein